MLKTPMWNSKKDNTNSSNAIKGETDINVDKLRENEFLLVNASPEEYFFAPIKIASNHTTQNFKIEYATDFDFPKRQLKRYFKPLMQNDPNAEIHRGFVKIGFGNYLSPFAAASISNKNQEKYLLNFDFEHHASFEGAVDKENSANSSTTLHLNTKYFFDNANLSSKISYRYDIAHFYGYSSDLANSIEAKDIRQIFNTMGFSIKYKSNDFETDFQYQADLKTHYFTNKHGAKEFEINPELGAKYKLNAQNAHMGLQFGTSISALQDITNTNQNSVDSKRYLAWIAPLFEKKIRPSHPYMFLDLSELNPKIYLSPL